jgi:hypothetical protein
MELSLEDVGLISAGILALVFVVVGVLCAVVVLVDEIGKRRAAIRKRRAQIEAVRRYRVPTQR